MAAVSYETMMVFSVKNGDEAATALKEKFQKMIIMKNKLEFSKKICIFSSILFVIISVVAKNKVPGMS